VKNTVAKVKKNRTHAIPAAQNQNVTNEMKGVGWVPMSLTHSKDNEKSRTHGRKFDFLRLHRD
jgi:hypothetical protein